MRRRIALLGRKSSTQWSFHGKRTRAAELVSCIAAAASQGHFTDPRAFARRIRGTWPPRRMGALV